MSSEITAAHVRQFKDNITLIYQQDGSVLRGTTQERSLVGEVDFWDRLGKTAAVRKTTRHADTPQVDTPHSRRMCNMDDWEIADLIDKQDRIRILIDPQSAYARAFGMALGRAVDDTIIAAFSAAVSTGQTGTGTTTFAADWPATRASASSLGGDQDLSGAALTVPNLATLKKDLDRNDVPDWGRHIVMSSSGFTQLLSASSAPQISNADYATVKALVNGQVDTFMGFKFHRSTRMPLVTGTKYYGFAWQELAVGLSMGMEMITRVTERDDKSYSTQVYAAMSMGAVRIQGEGVVRFQIDDAL